MRSPEGKIMDLIKDGLYQLFFELKPVLLHENDNAVAVFIIACAIIGVLAVFLDLAFYVLRNSSLLELNHSLKNTVLFLFAWSFGAGLMGLIGQMFEIFQVSLAATVVVGFSWPILFTGLLDNLKERQQAVEPEQQVTSEE